MFASACIEWIFAEECPDIGDRVRAARDAGLEGVEFHLWRDKPLEQLKAALDETGMKLTSFVVEPRRSLVDPAQHGEFLTAVEESLVAAKTAGSPALVVASGFEREGVSRAEQHDEAVGVLRKAAALAEAAGVTLFLEPLNTRVEHPGMFLSSTAEGLDMVEEVGSPALRLLFDAYHSATMDEDIDAVLDGRAHLVGHVQFADSPGRHEPGTGTIDWPRVVSALRRHGYDGAVGLEYKPTAPAAESLAGARAAIGF